MKIQLASAFIWASVTLAALVRVNDFPAVDNPTGIELNIWAPTNVPQNAPIVLALHGCLGTGEQYAQMTKWGQLADQRGFIVLFPSSKKDNQCWDIASNATLTREGGGDTHVLVNMIQYIIEKYKADPAMVFSTGTSSGGMVTSILCAMYPDVFSACSVYSGIAAGCAAGQGGSSPFAPSTACQDGLVVKTSEEWVEVAKNMYPGYGGAYPRIQTWHGTTDTLVKYGCLAEQIKQWSGIHGVTLTKNNTNTPENAYTEMIFGDGTLFRAYSAQGVGHVVPTHENLDVEFFGL
ncbi:Alpha/Beta hydrolase protein [Peziza echinospora]|nr:Alpha/Beta hydrolase protein [Peziza echinospora]